MMPKTLLSAAISTLILVGTYLKADAQLYGDFPYNQTFTSGSQPAEVTAPTGAGTNAVNFTANGMLLTPASNTQFGAVFINNKQFSSNNGIKISFEYSIYGGTGADGISVFLFDASISNPVVGSKGRGLGFAYNRANNEWPATRKAGLTGGYLSIGLDAYGNNKSVVYQGEERLNGVPAPSGGWAQSSSHVTLRGATGVFINNNGLAAGYTGNPVLITRSTLNAAAKGGAILNNTGGGYTYTAGTTDNFNLRPGTFTTSASNAAYRKAFIDLIPNAAGGFNITVKIQHGTTISTVIDNYWYKTSLIYTENANPSTTDFSNSNTQGANSTHTLDATVPDFFRIGFAASTGGLNDNHIIRNLTVVLPNAAAATDDSTSTCRNTLVSLSPLQNDLAYSGPIATATSNASAVDPATFQFHQMDNSVAATAYNVSNAQGTWIYNATTKQVTFTPASGFFGAATIKYSIKGNGTPYSDEAYRSGTATLTVVVNNPAAPVAGTITATVNGNDGTAQLNGLPATGNWTINEMPGLQTRNGSGTTTIFNNLAAGNHTFTVTDANGCSSPASATVFIPTGVTLPVSLLQFTATKDRQYAQLNWTTAYEHNNKGFFIEHSTDGQRWNNTGFVPSQAQSGNSSEEISYTFTDKAPQPGRNLYRLKQTDLDGQATVSDLAMLFFGSDHTMILYPNPTNGIITIEGMQTPSLICVRNTLGQQVLQLQATGTSISVDLSGKAAGLYYISVTGSNLQEQRFKLMLR